MNFKHKKKFGQNFLTNQDEVLNKIIEVSSVNANDSILEIGPGEGALTGYLLDIVNDVICVEIDKELEKILLKKYNTRKNFKLIMQDILKVDFDKEISKKVKVVANIPYYITSPIINKLIENRKYVEEIYIMVQKEVAERICSKKGKNRSILTLSVEYFGEAEYLFTIPKEYFTPVPKVDSAFMSIKLYKDNRYLDRVDEKTFFRFVKAAFSNKRKNIVNNLKTLGYSREIIEKNLEKLYLSNNLRAENLSIDNFIDLIILFKNGDVNV
ncbi:dimethyladenosine transferase [Hypnocyclicus thermotrophus]|uniref:Ribosomal RNA small subunit methyltransferase A n=1 Tax=Hypnocyclicus thermotrophus TaxID=1627895 RepID=A0AA46DXL3_9FUSO|nr:16S rRNA (adenine(1518)-N(6)/adenine(1519)-N(6))-dimethyltransferase RsmA [Hypnocyclicus thermotrophus]TDT68535.1 dimethyladenosine transferase [Hypnocyclicus thermotrophus]